MLCPPFSGINQRVDAKDHFTRFDLCSFFIYEIHNRPNRLGAYNHRFQIYVGIC